MGYNVLITRCGSPANLGMRPGVMTRFCLGSSLHTAKRNNYTGSLEVHWADAPRKDMGARTLCT